MRAGCLYKTTRRLSCKRAVGRNEVLALEHETIFICVRELSGPPLNNTFKLYMILTEGGLFLLSTGPDINLRMWECIA